MSEVRCRKHLVQVLPALLAYLVLFIGFVVAFLVCYLRSAPDAVGLQIGLQVIALWAGAKFIWGYLKWMANEVVVTPTRISVRSGWLSRSDRTWNLASAVVECRQGLIDRVFGIGTLVITSIDGQTTILPGLEHFVYVQRVLQG